MRRSTSSNPAVSEEQEDEEILDVRSARISSARSSYASPELGTGREEEDLLRSADGVKVSKEDRQNGYDTSLLSLQPRNSTASAALSTSTARPTSSLFGAEDSRHISCANTAWSTSGSTYGIMPSSYNDAEEIDEASSFSSSFDPEPHPTQSRRPSVSESMAPVGINLNPRFAANAYAERAQRSESQSKLSHYRTSASLHDGGLGDEEAAVGEKGALNGRSEGAVPFWRRRKILLIVGAAILFVCVAIGVGTGVAVSNSSKSSAASSSTTSSAVFPSLASDARTASVIPSSVATSATTTSPAAAAAPTGSAAVEGGADSGQYTQGTRERRRRR